MTLLAGSPLRLFKTLSISIKRHWSMSDYGAIKVRGLDYLDDAVKISPPCPPTMEIVHLEIYMCDTQVFHVCSKKGNWLQQYKAAQA